MFDKLKDILAHSHKKEKRRMVIAAPMDGELISVAEVNDPTFSEEMLGKGVAVRPCSGRVVSPVDGTVTHIFDTGHGAVITSIEGVEVLMHIGLDTVKLKGAHFTIGVQNGDNVSTGDVLIEFDLEEIVAAGYDMVTPVVICNSDDFEGFEAQTGRMVKEGEEVLSFVNKRR